MRKSIKKLKKIIDTTKDTGKLPKGLSLTDFRTLEDVYNNLLKETEVEFISNSVKTLLDSCGIKTREKGIGWIVYVAHR